MAILLTCSNCNRSVQVAEKDAGKSIRCKKCGGTTLVPNSTSPLDETKSFDPARAGDTESPELIRVSGTPPNRRQPIPRSRKTRKQQRDQTVYIIVGSLLGMLAVLALIVISVKSPADQSRPSKSPPARKVASKSEGAHNSGSKKKPAASNEGPNTFSLNDSIPLQTKIREMQDPTQMSEESVASKLKSNSSDEPPITRLIAKINPQIESFPDGYLLPLVQGSVPKCGMIHVPVMMKTQSVVGKNSVGLAPVLTPLQKSFAVTRISPDDQRVAAMVNPTTIQILPRSQWMDAPELIVSPLLLEHRDPVLDAAFSRDGKHLVTASGENAVGGRANNSRGRVRFWNAKTGEPEGEPIEFRCRVRRVVFSPNGRTLVATANKISVPTQPTDRSDLFAPQDAVHLLDVESRKPLFAPLKHIGEIHVVRFSRNGKILLTAGFVDTAVRIWNVETGKALKKPMIHPAGIADAILAEDHQTLITVCADTNITLRHIDSGKVVAQQTDATPNLAKLQAGFGSLMALSPEGKRMATAWMQGTKIRLWEIPSGKRVGSPLEQKQMVTDLTMSPDGRVLASSDFSGKVQLWSAVTGKPLGPSLEHNLPVFALNFGGDGRFLLASTMNGVSFWPVLSP